MKKLTLAQQHSRHGRQFVLPAMILMGIFIFFSIFLVFILSFCDVSFAGGISVEFIGLENYKWMLEDPKVATAYKNTLMFVFWTVPLQTGIALLLASILHSGMTKYTNFFRTSFFLPSLTSTAVLSMLFMFLFSAIGPVNSFLMQTGMITEPIPFMSSSELVMPTIIVMNIWQVVPYYMMIFLAGMSDIPYSLYESSSLDGATKWQQWKWITLPQVKTTTAFVILTSIIGTAQLFDQVWMISGGTGGPNYATTSVVLLIYQNAFMNPGTMGYAAALSVVFGVIIFIISFTTRKLQENSDEEIY